MPLPLLALKNMLVWTPNLREFDQGRYKDSAGIIIDYILNVLPKLERNILVLKSGTGTGKSTYLLSEFYLKLLTIGVDPSEANLVATQPAVANPPSIVEGIIEHGNKQFVLGKNIGYVTGGPKVPTESGIKVVTNGILMLEMINNAPAVIAKRYKAIFIDEVHKSSKELEYLLYLCKKASFVKNFPPIILMSGTLDEKNLTRYFQCDPVDNYIEVKAGFSYDMTVTYPKEYGLKIKDYDIDVLNTIEYIIKDGTTPEDLKHFAAATADEKKDKIPLYKPYLRYGSKDTLIFVNSAASIEKIANVIRAKWPKEILVVKIMGNTLRDRGIDYENLQRVLTPKDLPLKMKVIIATNAIETGITIDNLVYLVDSGMTKESAFNPIYNTNTLLDKPVDAFSKAQRQGRVARAMDGCFLPLYSKETENSFLRESYSKLVTEDCSEFILSFLVAGNAKSFKDFVFMDLRQKIPIQNIANSLRSLFHWGLIDEDLVPTTMGIFKNKMPRVAPKIASFVLHMLQYTNIAVNDIMVLAAFFQDSRMVWGLVKLDYTGGDFEFSDMKKTFSKEIGNPMFDFLCGYTTMEELWLEDILISEENPKGLKLDTIMADIKIDRKSYGNFLALVALLHENFYKSGSLLHVASGRVSFKNLSSVQVVSYFNQVNQVIRAISTQEEFRYSPKREKWVCTSNGIEYFYGERNGILLYLPSYIVMGSSYNGKYDIVTNLIIKV